MRAWAVAFLELAKTSSCAWEFKRYMVVFWAGLLYVFEWLGSCACNAFLQTVFYGIVVCFKNVLELGWHVMAVEMVEFGICAWYILLSMWTEMLIISYAQGCCRKYNIYRFKLWLCTRWDDFQVYSNPFLNVWLCYITLVGEMMEYAVAWATSSGSGEPRWWEIMSQLQNKLFHTI